MARQTSASNIYQQFVATLFGQAVFHLCFERSYIFSNNAYLWGFFRNKVGAALLCCGEEKGKTKSKAFTLALSLHS